MVVKFRAAIMPQSISPATVEDRASHLFRIELLCSCNVFTTANYAEHGALPLAAGIVQQRREACTFQIIRCLESAQVAKGWIHIHQFHQALRRNASFLAR